jgi:hypothetical protein
MLNHGGYALMMLVEIEVEVSKQSRTSLGEVRALAINESFYCSNNIYRVGMDSSGEASFLSFITINTFNAG